MKLLIAFITATLCACASNPQGMTGVPIDAFHEVDPGIYRGAQPDIKGYMYLRSIGVKTVLDLNDDDEAFAQEVLDAKSMGIDLVHVPLSGFWEPSDKNMKIVAATLDNTKLFPLYVHCQHGHDRTGLAIGLYRVYVDHWTKDRAHEEMVSLGFHPILIGLEHYFWE